jgi:hypothetical protein
VNRRRLAAVVLLLVSVLLLTAPGAGATTKKPTKVIHPPAKVKIGRVSFAHTPSGQPALLVAVRYPLAAAPSVLDFV